MSYRKWYERSWREHYAHQGWSSLCDDEVGDEAPAPPARWPREPYFEELEEALAAPPFAAPRAPKRSRRARERARGEEGEEEEEEEEMAPWPGGYLEGL